jgi:hypothetical protein
MISNTEEYSAALKEVQFLNEWLDRLARDYPNGERGLTMAGIRKKLAHIQEELAGFEAERGIAAAKTGHTGAA